MTIISTSDLLGDMPPQLLFVTLASILIAIPVVLFLMKAIMKNADNFKPTITKRVKIIERRPPKGNGITLFREYSIETDAGERLILRNYDEKTLILKEGDQGIMSYCGKTIKSFKRD